MARAVRLICVALALCALGLGLTSPANAAYPGQNGKIAFEIFDEAPEVIDIYSINPDGTGLTRLTSHPGPDRVPSWSPDGTRIAFASFRGGLWGIYTMSADGSDVKLLIEEEQRFVFSPTWSPDGSRIAYRSSDAIRTVNVDGTGKTTIGVGFDPAWSPRGDLIAYWRGPPLVDVFTIRPDGTGAFNVTNDPSTDDHSPDWAPDGNRILFYRDGVLHTIHPDGTTMTPVVPGIVPGFSPDGARLVYVELDSRRIATANLDGSDVQVISPGLGYNPDWQPLPGPRRSDYKNAAQFCKAERDFLGGTRFRERYGGDANAFGKCVSRTA